MCQHRVNNMNHIHINLASDLSSRSSVAHLAHSGQCDRCRFSCCHSCGGFDSATQKEKNMWVKNNIEGHSQSFRLVHWSSWKTGLQMTDVIQTVVHLWRLTHRRSSERWKHNIWCCWGESALVSHGEPFQSVSVNIHLLCKASTEFIHLVQPEHNKVQQDLPSSGVHSHLLCVAALLLLKCVAVERHASEISTSVFLNESFLHPEDSVAFYHSLQHGIDFLFLKSAAATFCWDQPEVGEEQRGVQGPVNPPGS